MPKCFNYRVDIRVVVVKYEYNHNYGKNLIFANHLVMISVMHLKKSIIMLYFTVIPTYCVISRDILRQLLRLECDGKGMMPLLMTA